jgi:hypothetical protein
MHLYFPIWRVFCDRFLEIGGNLPKAATIWSLKTELVAASRPGLEGAVGGNWTCKNGTHK